MTAPAVEPAGAPLPNLAASTDDFAALRALLARAGFTEPGVCERTGVPSIYDFVSIHEGRAPSDVADARDVLIRLFLDGALVPGDVIRRHLDPDALQLLERFGLVAAREDPPGSRCATVLLYPTQGFWIASDLTSAAAGGITPLPTDAVYPAITDGTRDYLAAIPATPSARCLEMCGGTGIAALVAARMGGHTWTADITERATRFAEFNARLNALPNVTAVRGDLYEPVRGLTFDRIVAHPPYVASPEQTMIYRDGGPDGEQFTRAILAGLPQALEPGGRFYLTCIAGDRAGMPLEQRVREMIGPTAAEYDVALGVRVAHEPADYYLSLARAGKMSLAAAEERIAFYAGLGVEKLVYVSMVVERHAAPCLPVTARRATGVTRVGESLEWLLGWERRRESPGFDEELLDARVRCSPGLRLRFEQALGGDDTGWQVERCEIVTERPFRTSIECGPDTATVVMRCDGRSTLRELVRTLVGEGLLRDDGAESSTLSLMRFFIGAGCLESEAFPLTAPVS